MEQQKLKRNLSFLSMVALASGAVIGGWLAEAPYWFELTGAGAVIIFPVLAVCLIPIGLTYSELSAMLPFASSITVWTDNAIGHKSAWFTQWGMLLVQLVQSPGMAFILVTALQYFFPFPDTYSKYIAMGIMILWYILSNFNISLTGTLSTIFFFSMIIISLIVSGSLFTSGHWSLDNITHNGGWFPMGISGAVMASAVFVLKFIGFEMTPTLIEETNFPVKQIWKVVFSALFFPALLYMIVVFAMSGMAPWQELAGMNMPEPELINKFGMLKLLGGAAIFSGILHAVTTIMGFWSSSSRVLYGGAKMNYFPKALMKLNRSGQPYISNIIVLFASLFFAAFTGMGNWVQYLYSVSCAVAGVLYFLACLDAYLLRKKHPEWERPFKVKGGPVVFILGMVVSVWIIIGSCMALPIGGYVSIAIFMLLGVFFYLGIQSYRKKNPGAFEPVQLTPADADVQ